MIKGIINEKDVLERGTLVRTLVAYSSTVGHGTTP